MSKNKLTAEQSKAARNHLGLSQQFIAQESGINRSQLALFEVGKYQLEHYKLLALHECYERLGYRFAESLPLELVTEEKKSTVAESERNSTSDEPILTASEMRIADNIVVLAELDQEDVDCITSEILWNDHRIEQLAAAKITYSIWDDEPDTRKLNLIMRLMARNYLLIRELQAEELFPIADVESVSALARKQLSDEIEIEKTA